MLSSVLLRGLTTGRLAALETLQERRKQGSQTLLVAETVEPDCKMGKIKTERKTASPALTPS